MCPIVARFLVYLYTEQQCCTQWAGIFSKSFPISNGVKQGGVLSPLLFNVYIDVLLKMLQNSGVGCHVGNQFTGALAYADDVLLLCPSISALKILLSICEIYSNDYNFIFNAGKSRFLSFGDKCVDNIDLSLQGNSIPYTSSESHLGHLIGSDPDILARSVKQTSCDMYSKLNLLLRQFNMADCDVIYFLFKSYCVSAYGSQLWDFESAKVKDFFTSWRKCVRRIYNLPCRTHSCLLSSICCDRNIDVQLHNRCLNFVSTALHSKNVCVSLLCKIALSGSRSAVCNSINYICHQYSVTKYHLLEKQCTRHLVEPVISIGAKRNAECIRDFINLRSSEQCDDIDNIIEFLCVN